MISSDLVQQLNIFINNYVPVISNNSHIGTSNEYMRFISIVDQYKHHTPLFDPPKGEKNISTDPEQEMRLLIHMKTFIEKIPPLSNVILIRNAIEKRINKLHVLVPKKINFVWLDELGGFELGQIGLWIKANPDYEITLWTDQTASLSLRLSAYLQRAAWDQVFKKATAEPLPNTEEEANNRYKITFDHFQQELIFLQNDIYDYVTEDMAARNKPLTFNQAASQNLITLMISKKKALDEVIESHQTSFKAGLVKLKKMAAHSDNIKIGDINQLMKADQVIQNIYYKEIILRGNLSSVIDLVSLQILKQEGGYYFNIDALPAINQQLFDTEWMDNVIEVLGVAKTNQLILQMILDKLSSDKPSQLPARKMAIESIEGSGYVDHAQDVDVAIINALETVLNNPDNKGKFFKPLQETTVDPLFSFRHNFPIDMNFYHTTYSRAMVSLPRSRYIQARLNNWVDMFNVMSEYNIDGCRQGYINDEWQYHPIPQAVTEEFENAIIAIGRDKSVAQSLLSFRYEDYNLGNVSASNVLAGGDAHKYVVAKLMDPNGIATSHYLTLTDPVTDPFTDATFYFEEFRIELWKRAKTLLNNKTNYDGNIIISFSQDYKIYQSDLFLFNKNMSRSLFLEYNREKGKLITKKRGEDFFYQGKLRIYLTGHTGDIKTVGAVRIADLIFDKLIQREVKEVARVNITACELAEGVPTDKTMTNYWSGSVTEGFIYDFFHQIEERNTLIGKRGKIMIESLAAYASPVSIMFNGTAWTVQIENPEAPPEEQKKIALRIEEAATKIIFTQNPLGNKKKLAQNRLITYRRLPLKEGLVQQKTGGSLGSCHSSNSPVLSYARLKKSLRLKRSLRASNVCRFSTNNNFDVPITERRDTTKTRLYSGIDLTTARKIKTDVRSGTVLLATADSMALIAAMSAGPYEILISDNNLSRIRVLKQVLLQSLTKQRYEDWFASLDVFEEKKGLSTVINLVFGQNTQAAYQRLRNRVINNEFGFYHLDLTESSNIALTLPNRRSLAPMKSIYLGAIENQLETVIAATKREPFGLNRPLTIFLRAALLTLENNIKALNTAKMAQPLYYSSAVSLQSETCTTARPYLHENYSQKKYLLRAQQILEKAPNTLSLLIKVYQYVNLLQQENNNLLNSANIPSAEINKWIPIFSSLSYDIDKKEYRISYLHIDNNSVKEIKTKNEYFAQVKIFLDKYNIDLKKHYDLNEQGHIRPKYLAKIGKIDTLADIINIFRAFNSWLNQGITVEGNTALSHALQLHVYLGITSVTIGTFNTVTEVVTFVKNRLIKEKNFLTGGAVKKFWRGFKSVGRKAGKLAPLLLLANVAFSATELYYAENEIQRLIFTYQLIFDIVDLTLQIVIYVSLTTAKSGAVWMYPVAAVAILLAIALDQMRDYILDELQKKYNNIEKMKACGRYFNSMREGWIKGGFSFNDGVWMPYHGVVIKKIDLINGFVEFDNFGQKMRKMNSIKTPAFAEQDEQAYINLRERCGIGIKQTITDFSHDAARITLVLPTAARAKINPQYSFISFYRDISNGVECEAMNFFSQQENSYFIFKHISSEFNRLDRMGLRSLYLRPDIGQFLTELNFNYHNQIKTNIDVHLGNKTYHLIAPGFDKNQPTDDSLYKKHLHYHLHSPHTGKATIILFINRAQAEITIECTNEQVDWIIDASHIDLPPQAYVNKTLIEESIANLTLQGDNDIHFFLTGSINETITIKIKYLVSTRLIIQLPEGIYKINYDTTPFSFIPYHLNAIELEKINKINDRKPETIRDYLIHHTKEIKDIIPYIPIDNFILDNKEMDRLFYQLREEQCLYTANDTSTLFTSDVIRSHTRLLFNNQFFAWYQGDLSVNLNNITYSYKNVIWVSQAEAKKYEFGKINTEQEKRKLLYIYIPIGHLPSMEGDESYHSPSLIIKTEILAQAILFQQEYHYQSERSGIQQKGLFTYLIDTSVTASKEQFKIIEVNLPLHYILDTEIAKQTSLNKIGMFMQGKSGKNMRDIGLKIDPLAPSGKNVAKITFPQTTTSLLTGRYRLLWPLANSFDGITGIIFPNVIEQIQGEEIINHPDYLTHLSAAIKGTHADNHIFFWSILKNHNQLHALYIQKGYAVATAINLTEFGIEKNDVKGITHSYRGVRINTKKNYIYHLGADQTLRLQGLEIRGNGKQENWAASLMNKIEQIKLQQFVKSITLAPVIAITGLLHSQPKLWKLPAWFDHINQRLFITQEDNNQQLSCLGTANDGRGAWILDSQDKKNQGIYYLSNIVINQVPLFFMDHVLLKTAQIPKLQLLPIHLLANGDSIINAHLSINRNIQIETTIGLLIDINKQQNEFQMVLLSVNEKFTQKYFDQSTKKLDFNKIKIALDAFKKNYIYPEIIKLAINNKILAWYHAQSENLFVLDSHYSSSDYRYLGFSAKSEPGEIEQPAIYFISQNKNPRKILKISGENNHTEIINSTIDYQRKNNLLILNGDATENFDDCIYIEDVNVLIATTIAQSPDQSLLINIALLHYPVIHFSHAGQGMLICQIPNIAIDRLSHQTEISTIASPIIARKNEHMFIFTDNKLLIIEDAFDTNKNIFHARLTISYNNNSLSVDHLATHYMNKFPQAKKETYGKIPLLNLYHPT